MKLSISVTEGVYLINVDDIICLQASSNYTRFYLSNNRKIVSAKCLKEYDALLCKTDFCRVHQSYLINKQHISAIKINGIIELSNKMQIVMARRRKVYVKAQLSLMTA